MNEDDKEKCHLVLYWHYTIIDLFPPAEFSRQDIKDGIEFLKIFHVNKYKKSIIDKKELYKDSKRAAAFTRLKIEVPQKYYEVDFQKQIEGFKSYTGLPPRPSVEQLASIYGYDKYPTSQEDLDWEERIFRDQKEIDKLVQRMIPDDPLAKFFEFVKELKKDVTIPIKTAKSTNSYTPDQYIQVNRQLSLVQDKYKVVQRKLRSKLGFMSNEEFRTIIYDTKKKNGKPNYSKMGKILGYHHTTIKSELKRRDIIP